ncbi:MAG: ClbS/DfsB family four-helix bundle protein [Candidatus Heimdallarchaeum aukensis]|uniref:ClbS/DfsB family four-helix bundle protein n=1 Tax=Candidatus Heimdallarchaeum aukensis TaxID=2876573 RepID=A0A9Y1FLC9_9ARCH|nr:MAG: ClbS/DfsB family four-helix bundle protein [Candidatus Heimdallarchaeum aukensis]
MTQEKIKPTEHINKFEKTTEIVLDLSEDFSLSNGWGKKELIAHLLVWDIEILRIVKDVFEGKEVVWSEEYSGSKLDEWNDKQLEQYKEKSLNEVVDMFKEKREELIKNYKLLIEKNLEEKAADLFGLWKHDLHHIKQVKGESFDI